MIKSPPILIKKVPAPSKFAELINGTITEVTQEDLQGNTTIKASAFSGQTYLRKVELPNTIESIGTSAFNGCTSLSKITLPESIKTVGGSAFNNCTSLTKVEFSDNITSIGENAFCKCAALSQDIILPPDCKVWNYAFFDNINIKSIVCGGYAQPTTASGVIQGTAKLIKAELREGTLVQNNFIGFIVANSLISTKGKFVLPSTLTTMNSMATGNPTIYAGVLKGTTPPIMSNANNFKCTKYFTPLEGIPNYESADNWQTYRGKYYPLVNTFADLLTIDTSVYTTAMTIDNDYQEYKYSNGEWVEVNK